MSGHESVDFKATLQESMPNQQLEYSQPA